MERYSGVYGRAGTHVRSGPSSNSYELHITLAPKESTIWDTGALGRIFGYWGEAG